MTSSSDWNASSPARTKRPPDAAAGHTSPITAVCARFWWFAAPAAGANHQERAQTAIWGDLRVAMMEP